MSTPTQQTTQNRADGKTAKPALETAPEPIDDGGEVVDGAEEGAEQPRERVAAEEQPQRVRPELYRDDARERIAKLYREQRDAEERAAAGAEPPAGEEGEPSEPSEPSEAQDATPAAEPAPSPGQQQIKIVVDGREEFLPLDEVVRRAQISSATESRLEEAKRLLKEAKEMRAAQPAHQPAPAATPQQGAARPISQPDPQPTEHQRGEALDPAKLGGIVERIQVGDKDEGAAALAEYTDEIERRVEARVAERLKQANVDPTDLDRRIDARQALVQTEADMRTSVQRFAAKYPEVITDPDLGVTGSGILARLLVDEVKAHSDLTDADLAPYRFDVKQLAHAVAELNRRGQPTRSFDELLDATGKVLSDKYGFSARATQGNGQAKPAGQSQPQPARNVRIGTDAEIAARNDRKRTMPAQPRPAGVRAQPAPAQPQPKTAAQIVAEQRRARGFPVN